MMTERERVLTLLRGGKPDRVPWFGDLDYWATALIGRGLKPAGFKASDAYIDWHRTLRVGFYLQGYFPFRTTIEGCRISEWREGPARRRRIETPRGTLTETWTWLPESFAEAPTEHLVKSAADLPAYRSLFEHTRYEPDHAFAETRARQVGGAGIVLCYLPKSPFMQMVALDAGIAAVAEIDADAPGELAETLAAVRAAHDRAARIALAGPAEVLMIPEYLSSEVVGPRFYDLHMRDYHESWCREIAAFTYNSGTGRISNSWDNPEQYALFRLVTPEVTHYFLGIEDILLSERWNDRDYNDYVVKFDTHPVPEPGTLLLLGSGVMALAARRTLAARKARRDATV